MLGSLFFHFQKTYAQKQEPKTLHVKEKICSEICKRAGGSSYEA
jgi:hypothetical protein